MFSRNAALRLPGHCFILLSVCLRRGASLMTIELIVGLFHSSQSPRMYFQSKPHVALFEQARSSHGPSFPSPLLTALSTAADNDSNHFLLESDCCDKKRERLPCVIFRAVDEVSSGKRRIVRFDRSRPESGQTIEPIKPPPRSKRALGPKAGDAHFQLKKILRMALRERQHLVPQAPGGVLVSLPWAPSIPS